MIGDKRPGTSGPGTVVGANVKLVGTLQDASDIIVHGRIEGEVISSQSISVTETAYIKGPISAEVIAVAGKVNGSITATGKLEILPTGKVFGSITSKDLSIRSGAIFVGKCSMPEGEKEVAAEEKEAAPKEASKGGADYEVE
ncbi:MAG: polymer-forming cytoskeletal protein [Patescibacteria group bacterium]|jgi:cytoskeletal protein CcmA (bactofilin family)